MSFIHLDKSIVTFHFKEILEDGHLGGSLSWLGLGALLLAPTLLSSTSASKPSSTSAKPASSYRPGMSLAEWVASEQQKQSHLKHQKLHPSSRHLASISQSDERQAA